MSQDNGGRRRGRPPRSRAADVSELVEEETPGAVESAEGEDRPPRGPARRARPPSGTALAEETPPSAERGVEPAESAPPREMEASEPPRRPPTPQRGLDAPPTRQDPAQSRDNR